jgi:xylulokinase
MGKTIRRVHISGGGARSPLWRQIIADVLGHPVSYYAGDSSLGAAIAASVSLGLHSDFQSAVDAMTRALEETGTADAVLYEDFYREFQRLRDRVYDLAPAQRGNANHRVRAIHQDGA